VNRVYYALFLFLCSVYLFTYTPHINSSDGLAMFSTAESIIRRGALDIEQIRWMGLQQGSYGLDGLLYSRKGIGVPLGLLPLSWLGFVIPAFGMVTTSLLFNIIITALTAVIIMAYLQEIGFDSSTGLIIALTYGLSTLAWPYAKSLFSDPFAGLMLLSAAYCLLKYKNLPRSKLWWPFLASLFLAWNVAARYAEAVFLPLFGIYLLHKIPSRRWPKPIIAYSMPIIITGLLLLSFNLTRYGNMFNTGYLPNESFSGVLWQGVAGQLISPARGLLLYCPIFILSFIGMRLSWQRFRAETALALGIIIVHLLLYGKWFMWHGGYAWGPRFLIPTLPFWAIFLAPIVAQMQTTSLKLVYIILFILGLIPQLLSVMIDFSPFQNSLLDSGLPLFAPQTFFEWQYSPFIKAWNFINWHSLDLIWAWQGDIKWILLLLLINNILLTGFALYQATNTMFSMSKFAVAEESGANSSANFDTHFIATLSTILTMAFLLIQAHSLPATSIQQTVTTLNHDSRSVDAIIINQPELTLSFAELYKGHAPILGLNQANFPLPADIDRRLNETISQHEQIWWLPNWLPPGESAIEQNLLATGFSVREHDFEGQRLRLFSFPAELPIHSIPDGTIFGSRIRLIKIAYPPQTQSKMSFPIEFHWQAEQAIDENYHIFIHLVNDDGNPSSQTDGQPVNWTYPTSTWSISETIIDRHALWIPANTSPGNYRVRTGWYQPTNGQRLQLPDGRDAIEFAVRIQN
jgi:uncharacterized membrane protein